MDTVLKKRIANVFFDIFSFIILIIALLCLFFRLKQVLPSHIDDINLFAARSVFSRNKSGILSNLINNMNFNFENNYSQNVNGNNNNVDTKNTPSIVNSDINLPNLSNDLQDEQMPHGPNEKTYKIIESQFGSGGIKYENFYVKNTTGINIDISAEINQKPDINITSTQNPQVLIFHTHTSESYMLSDSGFFYESFYPRSLNESKNVVKVGQAVTEKLVENGINVVHDTTCHDSPSYNGSYARAAQTIKNNLEKYPSIQMVIDIHRDSLGSKETGKIKPTFNYKNKKAAQLMVISGCDPDGTIGFPNWRKNLRLALRVQKYCESMFPGITRPLNFAKVKYNEHLTPGSLLIEIGSDVNTLEEAVCTGTMLGEALSKMLNDLKK